MTRKTFRSFNPSFREARLAYETPPSPPPEPTPPAPEPTPPATPPPKPDDTEGRISEMANTIKELKKWRKEREDADKLAEDDKAKKKGDYEKLLKERDDKLAAIEGEHGTAKSQLEAYEKVLKGQLESSLKAITDEPKRKTVEKLLEGKPLADQVALLPEVLQAIGASVPVAFGGPTPTGGKTPSATELEQKEKRYEELLAKGNPLPAEKKERYDLMIELSNLRREKEKEKTT